MNTGVERPHHLSGVGVGSARVTPDSRALNPPSFPVAMRTSFARVPLGEYGGASAIGA